MCTISILSLVSFLLSSGLNRSSVMYSMIHCRADRCFNLFDFLGYGVLKYYFVDQLPSPLFLGSTKTERVLTYVKLTIYEAM